MKKLNFTLTQLEYALSVHQYGHIAKAAEACSVTQPTLSMQLQKLENSLGVILFDRSKKPIHLTIEGEVVLEFIKSTLNEAKKVETSLQTLNASNLEGELRVGIIPTVAPYLLPKILSSLESKLPKIKFHFFELQTEAILEKIKTDALDFGIMAIPIQHPFVQQIPLYHEPLAVFCHPLHPFARLKKVALHKLKRDDLWLLEQGHCLRNQTLELCSTKKIPSKKIKKMRELKESHSQFYFESGSLTLLRQLVENLGGYTLIPLLAQELFETKSLDLKKQLSSKTGCVIPLESPTPSREIGLVLNRSHYKKSLIETFTAIIQFCLKQEFSNTENKIPVTSKIPTKKITILPVQKIF
jgi:LysR family transcriptional regulator, hydrogen peroxide-inducible genes activator